MPGLWALIEHGGDWQSDESQSHDVCSAVAHGQFNRGVNMLSASAGGLSKI
jgi:hypothetical protein